VTLMPSGLWGASITHHTEKVRRTAYGARQSPKSSLSISIVKNTKHTSTIERDLAVPTHTRVYS
jgi:hypothetical protein